MFNPVKKEAAVCSVLFTLMIQHFQHAIWNSSFETFILSAVIRIYSEHLTLEGMTPHNVTRT